GFWESVWGGGSGFDSASLASDVSRLRRAHGLLRGRLGDLPSLHRLLDASRPSISSASFARGHAFGGGPFGALRCRGDARAFVGRLCAHAGKGGARGHPLLG